MSIQAAIRATTLTSCALGLGFIGPSCIEERTVPNPNHCENQDGNAWCEQRYEDGSRPYCILGNGVCGATEGQDGCVAELPQDSCYSPCGSSMTVVEDRSCLPEESSSSGSTSVGESTETGDSGTTTTGPMPCVDDEECLDAAAPFCEPMSGECVGCDGLEDGDVACAEVDASNPLCLGGACVACTDEDASVCDAQALVCDEEMNACVPCTEHAQCGEAACNLFDGTCLPADAVARVGPGQEFTSIGDAVGSFGAGEMGTIVVFQDDYNNQPVVIDGGRVLAFLGAEIGTGVEPPRLIRSAGTSPQLTVTDGTVLMDGIQVSGNASSADPGVLVDGGRAWLDRSRVVTNLGGGIVASNAGELVLRNCFVGTSGSGISAVTLGDVDARILYSTMFSSAFAATAALECTAAPMLQLRNSIVVTEGGALGDELSCSGVNMTHTATEALVPGDGNVGVGMFPDGAPGTWFVDVVGGDLGLQNEGLTVFANVGQWQDGDPFTDIDGEPRPSTDGAPDFAGADVPQ